MENGADSPIATEIDHWLPSASHRLSLREITPVRPATHRAAILCLHGLFADGRFFLGTHGHGPAKDLLDAGYTIYIGELRGHGRSQWPAGARNWQWGFDEYVREDIPALIEFAHRIHDGPLMILAHSMGGYAALVSLGLVPTLQSYLKGICVLSAAVNDYTDGGPGKRVAIPLAYWLAIPLGRLPASKLRLGTADEPAVLMKQFCDWAKHRAFNNADGQTDYWETLRQVYLPVFSLVGAADRFHASPSRARRLIEHIGSDNKTLLVVGRGEGFSQDYGHIDVLRGQGARKEVIPKVLAWFDGLVN